MLIPKDSGWRPPDRAARRRSPADRKAPASRESVQLRQVRRSRHRPYDSPIAPPAGGLGDRVTSARKAFSAILVGILVAGVLQACSLTPAPQEATPQAWAEAAPDRDRG